MGPDLTGGQDDNNGPLLSFEEVLRGAGDAQDPRRTVSSIDHKSQRADGAAEYPPPIDR